MTNKSSCKIAVLFSYIFNTFSDIPLDFHKLIRVVPLKKINIFGSRYNY